jgi:hypothetical protein
LAEKSKYFWLPLNPSADIPSTVIFHSSSWVPQLGMLVITGGLQDLGVGYKFPTKYDKFKSTSSIIIAVQR